MLLLRCQVLSLYSVQPPLILDYSDFGSTVCFSSCSSSSSSCSSSSSSKKIGGSSSSGSSIILDQTTVRML